MFYALQYYAYDCIYNDIPNSFCPIILNILTEAYIYGYVYGIVPYALYTAFYYMFITNEPAYNDRYQLEEVYLYRFTKAGCVFAYVSVVGIFWPIVIAYILAVNTIKLILRLVANVYTHTIGRLLFNNIPNCHNLTLSTLLLFGFIWPLATIYIHTTNSFNTLNTLKTPLKPIYNIIFGGNSDLDYPTLAIY